MEALFARGDPVVALSFLEGGGDDLEETREAAASAGYRLLERTLLRSPYMLLDGSWESYEKALPSKRRSSLRRLVRRLSDRGTVSVEVHTGDQRLEELLAEGFRIEALGWKGKAGSAIESRADTRGFYTGVARWAAERDWLRLCFLRLDGQPLAFQYCLETGGVHYLVKVGYDPAYRSLAPGVQMQRDMIARAFAHGIRRYEFLGDEDPYKRDWTETVRQRVAMEAYRRSATALPRWLLSSRVRPVARRIVAPLRS
jgi:CelD/BcsL family acetyltransferase involved in cellulose biosynthesis